MNGPVLRWGAGVVPAAVASWALLAHDVAAGDLLAYVAWLALGVLGPGLLVSRAVLGRPRLLLAELGVAGVTGLLLTLAAWAVAVAAGRGESLRWWPLLVYLVFAAVPGLRRHLRFERYPERMTPLAAWAIGLSVAAATARFAGSFGFSAPLTGPNQWPSDLYWHLGNVELLSRQVRAEDSQVAGAALHYHWFGEADLAASGLASGVDAGALVSRLWALPILALTFAALVFALREVGPVGPRAAGISAVLLAAPAGLEVLPWLDVPWDPVFAPNSPSQNYSYPFLLVTVGLVARYLRGGGARVLVPLAVLLLVSPGVKSSALPILLSAALLAAGATLVLRGPWRRPVVLAAVTAAATGLGTLLVGAGGAEGSRVQLLSTLRRLAPYYEGVGLSAEQSSLPGGLLPPGVEVPGAWAVLLLLLLATALKNAWLVPGLTLLRGRGAEVDAAAWFLAGGGLAGWLLMLLVDQSGMSQVYFLSTGTVLWAVLAGWGSVDLLDRARLGHGARRTHRWLLGGAVAGAVATAVTGYRAGRVADTVLPPATALPPDDVTSLDGARAALAAGLVPATVLVLVALGWVLARRLPGPPRAVRAVAVGAGLVAASLTLDPWLSLPPPAPQMTRWAVSATELEAARWVDHHAGPHDVVATNVHCLTPRADGRCDARAFWVSALTRRRTFVGGWAYLDATRALGGRDGLPSTQQPFPDPARLALNDALFASPTPAVADALAAQGVRWVYADRRRGRVSPALGQVAQLVHRSGEVDVYRLTPRPPAP